MAIPAFVHEQQRRLPNPRAATVAPPRAVTSMQVSRILEMLQAGRHPTAYYQGAGVDNKGRTFYRFNYSDRAEPCFSGNIHANNNFSCFVFPDGQAVARCFSSRCRDLYILGQVGASSLSA